MKLSELQKKITVSKLQKLYLRGVFLGFVLGLSLGGILYFF